MDLTRLDRIAASLPPDDAAWLREHLEPSWRRRQRVQADRDAAVCALLALLLDQGEANPTAAASRLDRLLRRYLGSPDWRAGREPAHGAAPLRLLLHRLAVANEGKPLSHITAWRAWKAHQDGRSDFINSCGGEIGSAP